MTIPPIPQPVIDTIFTFVAALVAFVAAKLTKKLRLGIVPSIDAIISSAQIVDELQSAGKGVNAGAVLLIFTSNGGGTPSAGVPLKKTVLYEYIRNDSAPTKLNYQSFPVDISTIEVLHQLVKVGYWEGASDILSKGPLKDQYSSEHVAYTYTIRVYAAKTRFYYLTFKWYEEAIPTSAVIETLAAVAADKISKIIERTEK